jgi:polysaccharide pyruvyl transferase WcaK-like protein
VDACRRVADEIGSDRVTVVPDTYDQAEVKSIIASFDWFCGTRMHAAIAALSSGVPTSAIAYSPKTAGVFETCGQGRHVVDPRSAETRTVVEALVASFASRDSTRASLGEALPPVLDRARAQMDAIAAACGAAESPAPAAKTAFPAAELGA